MSKDKSVEVKKHHGPNGHNGVKGSGLLPEFNVLVDRFFGSRMSSMLSEWPGLAGTTTGDIRETDEAFVLCAEIPGIPKEAVEISVNGNLLTISAEQKEEAGEVDSPQGYRRHYKSFKHRYTIPSSVDAEKIEAHAENGILEVWLPKMEQTENNPKKVEIHEGKSNRKHPNKKH